MEESDPSLRRLLEERSKRADHSSIVTSNDALPQEIHDITCDNLLLEHGSNYIKDLTGLTEAQFSEIFDVCKGTINYDGPGRRYSDLKCRLLMYITWLTSGWTVKELAMFFHISRSAMQRTLNYMMSGTVEALKAQYLPATKDCITLKNSFEHFPAAIGAVDASLILVQKPKDRETRDCVYSGKHHLHGKKVQVVVSSDSLAIHFTKAFDGRRHDSAIFRESGLAEFLEKRRKGGFGLRKAHPPLLADSSYIGLMDVYEELLVSKKRKPGTGLSKGDAEWNKKLHSDRIIVENYFGRLKCYFGILSRPYRVLLILLMMSCLLVFV